MAASDYVILASNRLYGTVGYLDERYPLTAAYYRSLLGGELGFSLERTFTRYPDLFGVTIVDDTFTRPGLLPPEGMAAMLPGRQWLRAYADESLTVYDHPLVLVFWNEGHLSADAMQEVIQSGLDRQTR